MSFNGIVQAGEFICVQFSKSNLRAKRVYSYTECGIKVESINDQVDFFMIYEVGSDSINSCVQWRPRRCRSFFDDRRKLKRT